MSEYDFEVVHQAGRLHGNADVLSRMCNKDKQYVELTFGEFQEYKSRHVIPQLPNLRIVGDLFGVPTNYNLAHCVSHIEKGIAREFRERFDGLKELTRQKKTIGQIVMMRRGDRNIYYLLTKERYYEKPEYESLWKTLTGLRVTCEADLVLETLSFIFYGSSVNIVIYTGHGEVM